MSEIAQPSAPAGPSKEEVNAQLQEILESKDFQASPRLRSFLTYVVEQTLSGSGGSLKAYTIGVEVLGLGESFDPINNPMVRTEASRLRSKLEHYYLRNPQARVNISMPKGGYAAAFSVVEPVSASSESESVSKQKAASFYKASIMLLPFLNVNGSAEVAEIVNGINSSININLTRFSDLKVINYTQVQLMEPVFKGMMDRDLSLDTRFMLCGSVQLNQGIIEVHASLVDTLSMHNVWAEKFDAELDSGSILEVQENIAQYVVGRIADDFGLLQRTLLQELASGSGDVSELQEASLLYYHWTTVLTRQDLARARDSVEKAYAIDPSNVYIRAMLADLYACSHQFSYGLVDNPLEKSLQLASEAVNQDPSCQIGYMALALTHCLLGEVDQFRFFAKRAIELNPASTNALISIGTWYATLGIWGEALELTERLIDKAPTSPGWSHFVQAIYKYCHGDLEGGLDEARKINMPENIWDCMVPLAAGGLLGRKGECETALSKMLGIYPDFRENYRQIIENNLPDPLVSARVLEGIAQAFVLCG